MSVPSVSVHATVTVAHVIFQGDTICSYWIKYLIIVSKLCILQATIPARRSATASPALIRTLTDSGIKLLTYYYELLQIQVISY